MLEDRLDPRLQEPDVASLADRWKQNKRNREAQAFDDVADQIEQGLLKVRGVPKTDVLDRLRERADKTRKGQDRHRRKARLRVD